MPGKRKRGSYRKRGERVIKEYKKSKWTKEEDELLKKLVLECYDLSWLNISRHIPGKSPARCQYRWVSYLDTRINHKPITNEIKLVEDDLNRARLIFKDISRTLISTGGLSPGTL